MFCCVGLCGEPRAQVAVCGDGIRAGAEQCDDGNTLPSDGCDSNCQFEQALRVNSLAQQFTLALPCTQNAFGSAITGSAIQSNVLQGYTNSVADGSTTILLPIRGLGDLSGTNDGAIEVGVLTGTPALPGSTAYDGSNDLDWWYTVPSFYLDAQGLAPNPLTGGIAAKVLQAGPGRATLRLPFAGALAEWQASSVRLTTNVGASSAPLTSNGLSPGHLASEHLDPALQSFEATSGGNLCANIQARSLAYTLIPASVAGCGLGYCSQCYTASNSLLDLLVGGCTTIIGQQVKPTQPDTYDPAAPVAGNGAPYVFTADAQHFVNGCTAQGQSAPLADCLDAAAYSSHFLFTTDRVIVRAPLRLFADGFETAPAPRPDQPLAD